MRASFSVVPLLCCIACGQQPDHPGLVGPCDPAVMHCQLTPPLAGGAGDDNQGGAASESEEVAAFSGEIVAFSDDYFDQGGLFSGKAQVSATGRSGARVSAPYEAMSFELADVLKDPANWFLVEPAAGTDMLPTLMPLDTRAARADKLTAGVANATAVDGIFLASAATERALDRAQIVLHLVDAQLRSVTGVTGKLTAEVTAYRAAGSWVGVTTQNATDNSGMIFFGNVPAGSALSTTSINLTGAVTARVDVVAVAGAVSVVTAVVSP